MADLIEAEPTTDGRAIRRQRNIDAVLDVVVEMFAEESLFPTMEQAAKRSGLSLRSLYRYFADPAELLEAVIVRNRVRLNDLAHLDAIGEGPLTHRIDDFVAMRVRLFDAVGPMFRATVANAARHDRVRVELVGRRNEMREQFGRQFAPELGARNDRAEVLDAGDLLTQLDSINYLRNHRNLSSEATRTTLTSALTALLGTSHVSS